MLVSSFTADDTVFRHFGCLAYNHIVYLPAIHENTPRITLCKFYTTGVFQHISVRLISFGTILKPAAREGAS